MSSLQDAMAEVLLRAILARPDKCPPEILEAARSHIRIWPDEDGRGREETYTLRRYRTASWIVFKQALEGNADSLPAILADYEP